MPALGSSAASSSKVPGPIFDGKALGSTTHRRNEISECRDGRSANLGDARKDEKRPTDTVASTVPSINRRRPQEPGHGTHDRMERGTDHEDETQDEDHHIEDPLIPGLKHDEEEESSDKDES